MSCRDGVQDRDEEGIDCGRTHCLPCDRCNLASLPLKFDWRDYISIPHIRHQKCGSCWANSAAGTVEAVLILHTYASPNIDLPEQYLISCGPGSCDGGWAHEALSYIIDNSIPDQSCFPNVGRDDDCSNKCSDWKYRVEGAVYKAKVGSSIEDVKRALICHGPLSVGSNNWHHAIVLVGYDDNSAVCMNKYNKPGCWIIRNSWGVFTDWDSDVWHVNGYGYIPYTGFKYSDIKNRAYYVVPADYALHIDFEEGDGFAEIIQGDRDDYLKIYTIHGFFGGANLDFEKWDELAVGDVNGDGVGEIIHGDRDDRIDIYSDVGGFHKIRSFNVDFEAGDDLEAGDVNGDGKDEIVHGDRDNWIRIYDMHGTKLREFRLDFEGRDGLQCGDVDGNGVEEIIHADRNDWLRVYSMYGVLMRSMRFNFEFGDGFAVADVDGDEKADIVHGDRGDSIHIIKGYRRWI